MRATLLVEILTEELPPKALRNLGISFAGTVYSQLVAQGFAEPATGYSAFATPRRLGVSVANVSDSQAEQTVERKGPALKAGLDAAGNPTPALLGFAKSCAVAVQQLATMHDGKQECFVFRSSKAGLSLHSLLTTMVGEALKKLPAAKLMRWGESEAQFIRPVHGLVMMHGAEIVSGSLFGLQSGNSTWGHRFMGLGRVTLESADDYAEALRDRGCVIADFAERERRVREQLREAASAARGRHKEAIEVLGEDTGLLEEVTALVEWPATYAGTFSEEFLRVPPECLVLSMQQHQKYFPLADAQGKLLPRFLMVSNLAIEDPDNIVQGNERVLRARLADATFFFDQDRKTRLADRVPRLAHVVFHNKLGTQLQRVQRIENLAGAIARQLGADPILAERAAYLCKADLLTDMVGEFPELQGIMGQYYARHDSEPEIVARAIEAHYHPRFAGDILPRPG